MAENIGFEASFACFICDFSDSGLKLRKARVLSDALDCHLGNGITISTVETGRSGMSDDTVDNICSLFGIDKNWLLTGEGEMFSPGNEKSIANKEEAGSRVRKVRKDNNLTQEQFGVKIGYSMVMVHLVEAGKATATNDFLSRISSVFGISYNWLLTGEGEEMSDEAVVDDKLIEWLRRNPDVVRRLRIEGNLD